jgi:hypothetical protein
MCCMSWKTLEETDALRINIFHTVSPCLCANTSRRSEATTIFGDVNIYQWAQRASRNPEVFISCFLILWVANVRVV